MAPKVVLAAADRRVRAAARQELGALANLVVAPSTLTRYVKAVRFLFEWMAASGIPLPAHISNFDLLVSDFIGFLWEDGAGRSQACDTLSGLQHHCPALRHRLPCSWRLISAWQRRELPSRAPPLTTDILLALCGWAWRGGHRSLSAIWALAFHCLLRTHEFMKLRVQDLVLDARSGKGVVQLHHTKYGTRQGTTESTTIDCSTTAALVRIACRGKLLGDLLAGVTGAGIRRIFRQGCDFLGLSGECFRPYSLRRGGATFDFRSHGQLSRTVVRGRWNSPRTARIYINEGVGVLAQLRMCPQSEHLVRNYSESLKTDLISLLADG